MKLELDWLNHSRSRPTRRAYFSGIVAHPTGTRKRKRLPCGGLEEMFGTIFASRRSDEEVEMGFRETGG
ncbi:MAG: hypothetical protein R3D44_06940 [Hyphomicrobiaceae bacterium]